MNAKPSFWKCLVAAFSARPFGMFIPPNWIALFPKGTAKRHQVRINGSCSKQVFRSRHRYTHLLKVLFRLWVLNFLS